MERGAVPDGVGDHLVVPVSDDNTSAHKRRYLGKPLHDLTDRLDAELSKEPIYIDGLVTRPGIHSGLHELTLTV